MKLLWMKVLLWVVVFAGIGLLLLLWWKPSLLGIIAGSAAQSIWLWSAAAVTLLVLLAEVSYRVAGWHLGHSLYRRDHAGEALSEPQKSDVLGVNGEEARQYLRHNLGFFWRRRTRLLLVIGEPDEVVAIAPGLAEKQWLEGEGVVLCGRCRPGCRRCHVAGAVAPASSAASPGWHRLGAQRAAGRRCRLPGPLPAPVAGYRQAAALAGAGEPLGGLPQRVGATGHRGRGGLHAGASRRAGAAGRPSGAVARAAA